MQCIGCDQGVEQPAAYAIMAKETLRAMERKPDFEGPGAFGAVAICTECYTDPSHRTRVVKAHFALPQALKGMLGKAGSSGSIG